MLYLRGRYAEYRLVQLLRKRGYIAVRVARSGSGSYSFDVLAIKNLPPVPYIALIEVKRRSDMVKIYMPREKVKSILQLASTVGADALIALYVSSQKQWYVRKISDYDSIAEKNCVYWPNVNWVPLSKYMP